MEIKDIYTKTITILNKLNRKDSATGLDVWYKSVIKNASYYTEKTTNVSGTNVSMGQTFKVLIPFNDNYLNYAEWKKAGKQTGHFTISQGDYIVLGEIEETQITPNNIQSIRQKYEPNVCDVRFFTELNDRGGATVQLRIEGV